ncbi:MAG TPA: threonine/serine dehydratase [Steroidobacteraceae bacterium]|nr:threonine/serine dehydratase [Steroidobacteraceae bacterium]
MSNDFATVPEQEPDIAAIQAAAARIRPFVRRTPVVSDESLDEQFGGRLFFKCENLQRGGAFKLRGASNAICSLTEALAARGVATHSSGNHGAALALAARQRGIPAVVVMPENSSAVKLAAVRSHGAEVILCPPGRIAREAALAALIARRELHVIHPYDDYRVIAGQGTACLELIEEHPEMDIVLAPVGGGGLLSGTAIAARGLLRRVRVIGVEPEQADDAWRSFKSGERVLLDAPDTVADGLRSSLGARNFPIIRRCVDDIVRVSEDGILRATRLVLERLKLLVEPSAAVVVAALLEERLDIRGRNVGVILSGGNVDLETARWLRSSP